MNPRLAALPTLPQTESCPGSHFEDPATLWMYRGRTCALLRRYCRLSVELGRLPSVLGREFFRSRCTSYRMTSFEDVVVFVYDVEKCLAQLGERSRELLGRLVLQEYSFAELAREYRISTSTVRREFAVALDRCTAILLRRALLNPMPRLDEPPTQVAPVPPRTRNQTVTVCPPPSTDNPLKPVPRSARPEPCLIRAIEAAAGAEGLARKPVARVPADAMTETCQARESALCS